MVDTVHPQVAVVVRVGIPQLIHIVSLTLPGSLTEIERREVHIGIAQQGVTHHEIVVELTIATGNQTAAVNRLSITGRLDGRHRCRTHLHPYEFPIEIKVIRQKLS
jgi:hypothetical protein